MVKRDVQFKMESYFLPLSLLGLQVLRLVEGKHFSITCPVGYKASCQEIGNEEQDCLAVRYNKVIFRYLGFPNQDLE